ncbi:unnamed protein product [Rotaria sp. Silwood2]|nr:unnamed protein product [Rotaria sp. Silwood2]
MSSTSFTITSTQFSIFAGLPIFIFGVIGNLINIGVLFSSLSNSCSFLLFIASFFNIIALSAGLLPRVLAIGFGIDPSLTNLICCNTTTRCSSTNPGLVFYGNYFVRPVLLSILPGTILGISGWLTYRNITSITRIQIRSTFQRSFTSMILLQIFTVVIPIIPFATMNIYQVITSSMTKSSYRIAQETLVLDISNIILYISYASNFYVYLISASSYRRDFMRLVLFCYG